VYVRSATAARCNSVLVEVEASKIMSQCHEASHFPLPYRESGSSVDQTFSGRSQCSVFHPRLFLWDGPMSLEPGEWIECSEHINMS
jgi:hypothetical protein